MEKNYYAIIFILRRLNPILLTSSKLQSCFLKQPLNSIRGKRIRNYI